ncbi:hypothetical protein A9P82_05035 [Arachidicoccus ginsenosidimutans]|uniref:hypothetical protein n=1 Tax=Arachidicoccus sp. BS20 TaxID=1850526 RepID=UPI0007F15DBC|nr:hypothetical protein [Arachidicoccus sp. BS20]ANI88705.1 hypothetical protein A9P82_05035 [Arachidicoccus sp. BS20]
MDMELRKITFVREFLRWENENVIDSLEKLLRKSKADLYEEKIKPISETLLNAEIDEALDDSENDRVIKAKDLKIAYEKPKHTKKEL